MKLPVPLLPIFLLIHSVQSTNFSAHVITSKNWALLAKYLFKTNGSRLEYEIKFERENSDNISLLLIPDNLWTPFSKADTCHDKVKVLSYEMNQIIPLSVTNLWSGCELDKSWNTTLCKNQRMFSSSKDRMWYVSIANCNSSKGLDINYKISMKNNGDLEEQASYASRLYTWSSFVFLGFVSAFLLL
ncbi:uncharacterized protein LOC110860177 [Folsomia candida]|uniref:uncharacterized protein LOC110860177 n=1 Tax=Folsomia candida TaxID=158441 RepID=UPI000B907922|nr:uncharacterized protein LOC110860177 [Folsomia candida]